MISASHHASKHAAHGLYALTRTLAGREDAAFWERQHLLHLVACNRPLCHADALIRLNTMTDDNPLLPAVLKLLVVHGSKVARGVEDLPAPSLPEKP